MLISIIIPTYNRADLLVKTVQSILCQSYKNFEIIIVSDGSTDETKEKILKINDNRLIFLELNKNFGYPAKARNEGIKKSNGSFIAFCDDDDLWHIDKLRKQVNIAKKGFDFIFTNKSIINNSKHIIRKLYSTIFVNTIINFLPVKISHFLLCLTNPIVNSSVLLKKRILLNMFFSESISYKAVEDYQLWIKIYPDTKPYFLNENLVNYRIHESNISSDFINNLKKCLLIMDNIKVKSFSQRLFKMIGIIFYSIRILINK
jgi:teichuronic acid biosynthesis glycosyltransferase TuaG